MRGSKINFGENGPVFDFSAPLVDFDTTVQNAMVNTGMDYGSDPLYPDRGTNLLRDGVQGGMINQLWANHAANFSALLTLSFSQKTEIQSNPFKLQSFSLTSVALQNQTGVFNIVAVSVTNEQRGITLSA